MPIEPTLILQLAMLGLVTGFLAGLLGIGGGMSRWPVQARPPRSSYGLLRGPLSL